MGMLSVDPDCRGWHFTEPGKPEEDEDRKSMDEIHFAFANVRGRRLVSIGWDVDAVEAARDPPHWPKQYIFLRYEVVGRSIRLYLVDSEQVERLITAKAVRGHTEKTHRRPPDMPSSNLPYTEIQNYVEGDPREMARIALLPNVFDDQPIFVLKPAASDDIVTPDSSAPSP